MITAFLDDRKGQIFILKGYAGTGKTTLAGCIASLLSQRKIMPEIMAPTGRAAKVLRSRIEGCKATTIHKQIYKQTKDIEIEGDDDLGRIVFKVRERENMGIFIVDEASMISSRKQEHELVKFGTDVLINDILTYARTRFGGKIIFIGDPAQLPPVGDNRSAALDETFFMEKGMNVRSYTLTDVIRQDKESAILRNATTLRNMLNTDERNSLVLDRKAGEVDDLSSGAVADEYCRNDTSAAIVCYSNKTASEYNKLVRSILFPGKKDVVVGDRLMIVYNTYYKNVYQLNGGMITVTEVSDTVVRQSAPVFKDIAGERKRVIVSLDFRKIAYVTSESIIERGYIIESLLNSDTPNLTVDETKALFINFEMRMKSEAKKAGGEDIMAQRRAQRRTQEFDDALRADEFYNALQVKYGYAFTCHKAQGGEWDTVYVDFDKRNGLDDDSLRWKYTAVTRAKKRLVCVNLADISPIMGLEIRDIGKTGKYSDDALSFGKVKETPFHDANARAAIKCKYWSVVQNMAESDEYYNVENVKPAAFRDIYSVKTPTGDTVRVDAIYNGAGIFTK